MNAFLLRRNRQRSHPRGGRQHHDLLPPGAPRARSPPPSCLGQNATAEQIAVKRAELGLDEPLLSRFVGWVGGALTGDLGASWANGTPVASALATRVPITLALCLGATLLSALLGGALGIAAARFGGGVDRALQILAILGFALPGFWVAQMLSSTFAIQLKLFPAVGYTAFADDPAGWLRSITLPVLALTIGGAAMIAPAAAQLDAPDARARLRQDAREPWPPAAPHPVRLRPPRGGSRGRDDDRAAVRLAPQRGGGRRDVFALQGLGQLVTGATLTGDVPVVMGVVLVTVVIVVVVNLVLDVVFGILNPKARTR